MNEHMTLPLDIGLELALPGLADTAIFQRLESNVRTYCRHFPVVFQRASGAELFDERGKRYLDFFAGAGALNYGHNPPRIREQLIAYLMRDGILHGLDMHTVAKRDFLERFHEVILAPRQLDYKVQFCGPTGANAVEAAIKLARMVTGRGNIGFFSGGWHGLSLGALSATANRRHRESAAVALGNTAVLPYPAGPRPFPEALGHIENMLVDPNSGFDMPAALILETVQAEGGIYIAPHDFLRGLARLCRQHDILLIVDDIQAGCGRTGRFFSFEAAGIIPDLVCLSKSIGGCGLPMSLVLMRPELDQWKPGDHTGTFRGNQLAFLAATAALDYWNDQALGLHIAGHARLIEAALRSGLGAMHPAPGHRGVGMLWGVDLEAHGGGAAATRVAQACFHKGLIIETCGRGGSVIKLLPPLNIDTEQLEEGLAILIAALREACAA